MLQLHLVDAKVMTSEPRCHQTIEEPGKLVLAIEGDLDAPLPCGTRMDPDLRPQATLEPLLRRAHVRIHPGLRRILLLPRRSCRCLGRSDRHLLREKPEGELSDFRLPL